MRGGERMRTFNGGGQVCYSIAGFGPQAIRIPIMDPDNPTVRQIDVASVRASNVNVQTVHFAPIGFTPAAGANYGKLIEYRMHHGFSPCRAARRRVRAACG
jgi:hypothetical protein